MQTCVRGRQGVMLYKTTIGCTQLSSNILARQAQMRSLQINKECSEGTCCCKCTISYANTERSFPDVLIPAYASLYTVVCLLQTLVSYVTLCTLCTLAVTWSILLAHFSCLLPHCVSCMYCPSFPCAAMLMNIASIYITCYESRMEIQFQFYNIYQHWTQ